MNEYFFYTMEGSTEGPNEEYEVDNSQVLGRANGNTKEEAEENLLRDNPWITKAGFSRGEFLFVQIINDERRKSIRKLLDSLPKDGEGHPDCGGAGDRRTLRLLLDQIGELFR